MRRGVAFSLLLGGCGPVWLGDEQVIGLDAATLERSDGGTPGRLDAAAPPSVRVTVLATSECGCFELSVDALGGTAPYAFEWHDGSQLSRRRVCAPELGGQHAVVARDALGATSAPQAGVKTYVVRYGSPAGSTPEQDAQLRAIVESGGAAASDPADPGQKPYVDAQDDAALNEALAGIASTLATCSFTIDGVSEDADKDSVNLYLNGEVVPYDKADSQREGWGWLDDEQTSIQLYGEACTLFKTNRKTSVIVELGCAPVLLT